MSLFIVSFSTDTTNHVLSIEEARTRTEVFKDVKSWKHPYLSISGWDNRKLVGYGFYGSEQGLLTVDEVKTPPTRVSKGDRKYNLTMRVARLESLLTFINELNSYLPNRYSILYRQAQEVYASYNKRVQFNKAPHLRVSDLVGLQLYLRSFLTLLEVLALADAMGVSPWTEELHPLYEEAKGRL